MCVYIINGRSEPTFIEEIIIDVLKRLFKLSSTDAKRLVKEDSHIPKKEMVPSPHLTTIHIAGHLGISVRGRRPLKNVNELVSQQYSEVCWLIENVGEELIELLEKFVSKILDSSDDSDSDSYSDDDDLSLENVKSMLTNVWKNLWVYIWEQKSEIYIFPSIKQFKIEWYKGCILLLMFNNPIHTS